MRDYDFSEEFSEDKLTKIGKETYGGIRKKGRGDFGTAYDLAMELQKKYTAYCKGKKYKKDLLSGKETVTNEGLQNDFQKLVAEA